MQKNLQIGRLRGRIDTHDSGRGHAFHIAAIAIDGTLIFEIQAAMCGEPLNRDLLLNRELIRPRSAAKTHQ